jgi:hypothetical protein
MGKKKPANITLGGELLQRTPVDPHYNKSPSLNLINAINLATGANSNYLARAGVLKANSNKRKARMTDISIDALTNSPLDTYGQGLYASGGGMYAAGQGLYAGGHHAMGEGLHRKPRRRSSAHVERGSIGRYGTLLHQPQAEIPQPFGLNYMWGNTLPPYYHKLHQGGYMPA